MTRKVALALAAALTVFTLAMVAAVTVAGANLFRPQDTALAAPQTGTVEASPAETAPDLNAALQAAVAERDTYYTQQLQAAQAQLAEANTRLQQAYAELDKAQAAPPTPTAEPAAPAAAPQPAEPAQPATPTYAISLRRAALIALEAVPGASLVSPPGLVSFQGTPAYEVQLDGGPVYVDANTGDVLYNGAASMISSAPQSRHSGHDDDEDGEHGDD